MLLLAALNTYILELEMRVSQ